jgi:hypothetical protein
MVFIFLGKVFLKHTIYQEIEYWMSIDVNLSFVDEANMWGIDFLKKLNENFRSENMIV